MFLVMDGEYMSKGKLSNKDNPLALLSLGLIKCSRSGGIQGEYYSLVKTDIELSDEVKNLTGLSTDKLLQDGKSLEDIENDIIDDLREAKSIICWGNFDLNVFKALYERTGLEMCQIFVHKLKDYEPVIRHKLQFYNNVGIDMIAYIYNIANKNHHNALNDAEVLAKIVSEVKHKHSYSQTRYNTVVQYYKYKEAHTAIRKALKLLDDIHEDFNAVLVSAMKSNKCKYRKVTFDMFLEGKR